MSERINTPFTNEHFVAFCEKMVGQPYWYGSVVYKCTENLRARKAKQRAREDRIYTVSNILLKQDEDYTKRRRIWWIVLAIGMVLVVAIWASLYFAPAGMVSSPVQMVGIVLSYVIILGDFIYDFARIRPLRNMYRAQAEGMSENKLNALIERSAAEEDKKDSKKK